jgi:hypothetical protein
MFDTYLRDIEREDGSMPVFTEFLSRMNADYLRKTPAALKARDFITTLTDDAAAGAIASLSVPRPLFSVGVRWKRS